VGECRRWLLRVRVDVGVDVGERDVAAPHDAAAVPALTIVVVFLPEATLPAQHRVPEDDLGHFAVGSRALDRRSELRPKLRQVDRPDCVGV
jgi:hypothetical protein